MARRGFRWTSTGIASGANVNGVLELRAEDQTSAQLLGNVAPYVFDENGRISTSSHNGAALTIPDSYTFGEMWELRWSFAETGNSQRQGVYLQARSDIANSSTVRAMELEARQGAAVAIGDLTTLRSVANIASTSTGNITTARGAEIGISFNSADYSGTITNFYGLHIKNQIESGATITTGYGLYIETEAVSGTPDGTARLDAVIGVGTNPADGVGYFRYLIDAGGIELTNGSGNEVVLFKFVGANGTTYYVVHDTDSATALGVVTTDPTT